MQNVTNFKNNTWQSTSLFSECTLQRAYRPFSFKRSIYKHYLQLCYEWHVWRNPHTFWFTEVGVLIYITDVHVTEVVMCHRWKKLVPEEISQYNRVLVILEHIFFNNKHTIYIFFDFLFWTPFQLIGTYFKILTHMHVYSHIWPMEMECVCAENFGGR